VTDRGQVRLQEVTQLRENPAEAGRWHGGIERGESRRVCSWPVTRGFIRMHALTALSLDNKM